MKLNESTVDIAVHLETIHRRMAAACARSARSLESVRLLAVSKTFSAATVRTAADAGQRLFGENRVQEAANKIPACPGDLQWHLIGHLQGNKAATAVRLFDWIHSVDSPRLLQTLEHQARLAGRRVTVLLQVNVSGEISKSGAAPEAVPEMLRMAESLQNLEVRGLMTIPPYSENLEDARPIFQQLRMWRDRWMEETGVALDELSMGMTHDMEVAIEEGATIIRVGSGLFGERPGMGTDGAAGNDDAGGRTEP